MPSNTEIEVDGEVVEELERRVRNRSGSARSAQRAKLILMYLCGDTKVEISRQVGLSRMRVYEWIRRFEEEGLVGLEERVGRGRKESYTPAQRRQIVETACRKPTGGLSRWSVRTLAKHLSMDKDKVHRVLKEHDLHPHRLRTFNFSPDPQFAEKLLEVVGLYMAPPENAVVLCMDEKTGIQALDRTQPVLPLRSKKPRAWSNEYVRHGTRCLLAAVEIETGKATTWVNKTRKTDDFIKFMNQVARAYPGERLCVIMDNLNTHNGKAAQEWLAKHPRVSFHYTPTHASWVNLAECFFSIVSKQALDKAVHRSGRELEKALEKFIKHYNEQAGPFVWTKGPEKLQRIIELTAEFQRKADV